MKNTVVRIKAELENVKKIYCDENFLWTFNSIHKAHEGDSAVCFRIDSSSTLTRENIQFRRTDILDIPNSRGTANFLVKWTEYPKYSTINFVNTKNCCSYDDCASNEWKDFASFECRGYANVAAQTCRISATGLQDVAHLEESRNSYTIFLPIDIVEFIPCGNFIVEDVKGKLYYDVSLSDLNWCDYNQDHDICVGIYNFDRFTLRSYLWSFPLSYDSSNAAILGIHYETYKRCIEKREDTNVRYVSTLSSL
ncbi:hypothetical protein POVCU2_0033130 [Plasmodium ovale curtisi]|uniref:Uncharacterized protein n=1 Tax=Plasmodium ovale curtisi TaxID=864141 RepID=A0A1A8WVP1_PLAOA|nr:hypothetical protein POVCU2_0033130 [Plasmodium ovale curtisi]SBS95939.1 hypothetical protein POVCU1_030370 [Plasmodium ovale curtisi]